MSLSERLIAAFQADPKIASTAEDLQQHKGNTTAYMESLGLSKADMKKLERAGLAIRAKTPNGGLVQKEDGKVWKQFGSGAENRWVVFIPEKEEACPNG